MDSINKNQPEQNTENLLGDEALDKIREITRKTPTCLLCTHIVQGSFSTRPMSVEQLDDNGNFWFLSANDSNKNKEITDDSNVQLLFQGSQFSDFLNVHGKAEILYDKNKIEELWNPIMKTWFTEGKDDARITLIKITPADGYYWDLKHGMLVALAKRIAGAVAGKTYDDSIEGTLKI